VAGIDRCQHRVRRSCASAAHGIRRAARDRLPDVRVPADRPGCSRQAAATVTPGHRRSLARKNRRLGCPAIGGKLRRVGDSGAMGARARRMGGRREARDADVRPPVRGRTHRVCEGRRRCALGRCRSRARWRGAARGARQATGGVERNVLGRPDRYPAADRGGVAGVCGRTTVESARADAGGCGRRGPDGEGRGNAGTARARPRAAGRDAARNERCRWSAEGISGDASQGTEPFPHGVRRGEIGRRLR
jgi:hypothetical protein